MPLLSVELCQVHNAGIKGVVIAKYLQGSHDLCLAYGLSVPLLSTSAMTQAVEEVVTKI